MTGSEERSETRLLFDVSRLVWRRWQRRLPTGIDRTCLAYMAHYRDRASAVVQYRGSTTCYSPDVSRRLFELLQDQDDRKIRRRLVWLLTRALPDRWSSPDVRNMIYLNVGHTGLDRPAHSAWLTRNVVRPVYMVHDLIPLTHPEYCRATEPEKHRRRILTTLRQGAGVIANSQDTLNQLTSFADLQPELVMPPAIAAPLGIDRPTVRCKRPSDVPDEPYFVMVGTIEGRKNHVLILSLWAEMARQLGAACPKLVIIGQRGWESEQAVALLERCPDLRGHVVELSRCDDEQMSQYLAHAQALLFPSFVEGYGLPLFEALASGVPVIASNLAVFRELAGDIPDYLSPLDRLGWRQAIDNYAMVGSRRRADQIARLANWTVPTWQRHFATVDQWLPLIRRSPQRGEKPND